MRTDRVAARTQAGNHLRHSGKHKAFSGNMQVLTDRTGLPVRTAPMEPGSPHLHHRRPGPRPAGTAPGGLTGTAHPPADKSRTGAGIGIKAPAKNPAPDPDTRRHTGELIARIRAPAETANTLLKHFKALRHATPTPTTITNNQDLARPAHRLQKTTGHFPENHHSSPQTHIYIHPMINLSTHLRGS